MKEKKTECADSYEIQKLGTFPLTFFKRLIFTGICVSTTFSLSFSRNSIRFIHITSTMSPLANKLFVLLTLVRCFFCSSWKDFVTVIFHWLSTSNRIVLSIASTGIVCFAIRWAICVALSFLLTIKYRMRIPYNLSRLNCYLNWSFLTLFHLFSYYSRDLSAYELWYNCFQKNEEKNNKNELSIIIMRAHSQNNDSTKNPEQNCCSTKNQTTWKTDYAMIMARMALVR